MAGRDIKKLKFTPILETGFTIEYDPKEHPIKKLCHIHLRWAEEKCPICGSTVQIYYAPTSKHKGGIGAVFPSEKHKVVISCVNCNFMMPGREPPEKGR